MGDPVLDAMKEKAEAAQAAGGELDLNDPTLWADVEAAVAEGAATDG